MTALITPVCDAAVALRANREKTEMALMQVRCHFITLWFTASISQLKHTDRDIYCAI